MQRHLPCRKEKTLHASCTDPGPAQTPSQTPPTPHPTPINPCIRDPRTANIQLPGRQPQRHARRTTRCVCPRVCRAGVRPLVRHQARHDAAGRQHAYGVP
eukprot:352356-Chlamydomonas_euryale.AAC.5